MDKSEAEIPFKISERITLNGTLIPLTFNSDGILRWVDGGDEKSLSLEKEVLGVSMEDSRIILKCAVKSNGCGGGILCCSPTEGLVRKSLVLEASSQESLQLWFQKLREFLDSLGRPKRLFVLVNPYGGKKSALQIFVDTVRPLLEDAEIQFTLQETKYQLHAKELAYGLDLTKYDGVVCVSGDGILVEVVNGLLQRHDWDTAIKMPIGVIPAGTGNGVAKSLLDSVGDPCSAVGATVAIIRGHKTSLDIATISQGKTRFFSVLMLAWGLVADIDIESEIWRWMGGARLDLYAVKRIFQLRKYNGRIHFIPASDFEDYTEKISHKAISVQDLPFCSLKRKQTDAQESGYLGPNIDLENMNWRTIEGPFISVWIQNVPWGSEGSMPAPNAKFSDGYLDVILMKDCPKLGLLSVLTSLSNGKHVKSPHVLYFKVKSFILEPGSRTKDSTKGGIIDCDGEVLARGNGTYKCDEKTLMSYDNLQITIDQGLATLFCPPL
ncbi:sphingosine kinase 1-like isoform X1 [Chenopodium quinoa]|uniref:sphingosine kinase n=2 Tax=Chenopodium quinoa TaxID=63459 RepID=A0A803LL79_CHEQI|nr:sphingosine kinase 1-like isoform X1 [Chenopodium quinoa]